MDNAEIIRSLLGTPNGYAQPPQDGRGENRYPVMSADEEGLDPYLKVNPQVSGMAWGGGMNGTDPQSRRAIVLNPYSNLTPRQSEAVRHNEYIRHQMNESGWKSNFAITPEQQEWSKKLGAYANNPAALRETMIARLATGDFVPAPTSEQQQIANTFGSPMPAGQVKRGNINLFRPSIPNPEGGDSTVLSASFGIDGQQVLLPLADEGRFFNADEAVEKYRRTGQHLGVFETPEAANAYADRLHKDYERGVYALPKEIPDRSLGYFSRDPQAYGAPPQRPAVIKTRRTTGKY